MTTATHCWKCGSEVPPNSITCVTCGAGLHVGAPDQPMYGAEAQARRFDELLERLRAATIGEYEIKGLLGRGGMAVVYLAYSIHLHRNVAIKVMLPGLFYEEGMPERFLREAQTAARLDHPNIVIIHRVMERGELLFFEMRYVEGCSLERILRTAGALPVHVVGHVVALVADALAYAHERGVVHRDIKPSNVMIDLRGGAVVTDFGIARAAGSTSITSSGIAIGTPAYMSPEQVLAENKVTGQSDQYSLGIMAYEMLVGSVPFHGAAMEIGMAHVSRPAPAVRSVLPDCPAELADAIDRMLLKDPEQRFPALAEITGIAERAVTGKSSEARALLSEISRAAQDSSMESFAHTPRSPIPRPSRSKGSAGQPERAGGLLGTPPSPSAGVPSSAPLPATALRQKGWRAAIGVAVVLLVVASLSVYAWSRRPTSSPTASAPQLTVSSAKTDSAQSVSRAEPPQPEAERSKVSAPDRSLAVPKTTKLVSPTVKPAPIDSAHIADSVRAAVADSVAALPPPPPEVPKPDPVIMVGTRIREAVLYLNGEPLGRPLRLRRYVVKPGDVRITISQEGCVPWDTLVSVRSGDSLAIGFRNPACQ